MFDVIPGQVITQRQDAFIFSLSTQGGLFGCHIYSFELSLQEWSASPFLGISRGICGHHSVMFIPSNKQRNNFFEKYTFLDC